MLEAGLRDLVLQTRDPRAAIAAGRVIQGCIERRTQARAAYPAAWAGVRAAAIKAFRR